MRLPRKISPCPIVEAMVELRFTPKVPPDAVFGVVYNAIIKSYGNVESLPILQLPEALRVSDPNLVYKPTHKFINKDFVIQMGPRVITFSNINEYVGWEIFSKHFLNLLQIINKLKLIHDSELLILRYIDFFEKNIFDNSNLQISLNNSPLDSLSKLINAKIQENSYIHTLIQSDKAVLDLKGQKLTGSIIDISTQLNLIDIAFFDNCKDIINEIHDKQKRLFFRLLKDDFIFSLNPEY